MTPRHRRRLATSLVLPFLLGGCMLRGGDAEQRAGADMAKQVEEQIGLVSDGELPGYVQAIGARLAAHARREDVTYRFAVIDTPEPNAFALPGGFVYVSRGLLVLLNSEDELASVIGHEIGHVEARHHAKKVLRSAPFIPVRIVTAIGGAAASIVSPLIGSAVTGVGSLTSQIASAPYDRNQEREADALGQELAAAAGWDPNGLSKVMDALAAEQALHGNDPNRQSFLATHPTSPERARTTHERAARLQPADAPPIAPDTAAFYERLQGLLVGASARHGVFDGDDFLHPDLGFAIRFPDGWKQTNSDHFVAANDENESAAIVLQLAGEGEDALAVARQYEPGSLGARLEAPPAALDLGALPAARARVRSAQRDDSRAELTWIALGGNVYLVSGVTSVGNFDALQPTFARAARSFHSLTPDDRARIREDRLKATRARAGETLADILTRSQSRWKPEAAAVANARELEAVYGGGEAAKVTLPTPYASQGDAR